MAQPLDGNGRPAAKRLPLANIRVLEIAEGYAGPWAASLLGDLGAEVIKIEAIQRMDQTRGQVRPRSDTMFYPKSGPGRRPWNICQPFVRGNRNKLSLTLDLSRPQGLELFLSLVAVSDVVLTNMVTGVPEKLGIDYPSLRRVRPDLVLLTSCGYGNTGPYARYVAMAGSMDAISGHTWLRNYEGEEPPSTSYNAHTDAVNATTSAFAVAAAVLRRAMTGQGQHVDVSGCEAIMPHLGEAIMDYTLNGRVRTSIGNAHPAFAPHNVYPTKGEDQWVAIAVTNDSQWRALCDVVGAPQWATDPRFRDPVSRWRHRKELDALLAEWARGQENYQVMEQLQRAGVPAAAVLSNKDTLSDPHIRARRFFETVQVPDLGLLELSGVPWKMSETPASIRLPPPPLGAHNDLVYRQLLGLGEAEIARLEEEQYLGTEPLDRPV